MEVFLISIQDGMPGESVVFDFYDVCQLTPEQQMQAQWSSIDDSELDDHIPDYPDIEPFAQWLVISGNSRWMVYQWWDGPGSNTDRYLYVPLENEIQEEQEK